MTLLCVNRIKPFYFDHSHLVAQNKDNNFIKASTAINATNSRFGIE
jgi:hypothetical protein